MGPVTVQPVANPTRAKMRSMEGLLDVADALGLPLTHMAVHKVAYFAHGWHLAQAGAPLIAEEFEAWEYGPVLPTVYAAFKDAGRQPVRSRAVVFNPVTQQRTTAHASVAQDDAALIRDSVQGTSGDGCRYRPRGRAIPSDRRRSFPRAARRRSNREVIPATRRAAPGGPGRPGCEWAFPGPPAALHRLPGRPQAAPAAARRRRGATDRVRDR